MVRYLADSSIWSWSHGDRRRDIRDKLATRFERGEVLACAPVILETMHRARGPEEYGELIDQLLAPLERLPLTDEVAERALEVHREMARSGGGNHRRPAVDYLIAAIAEAGGDDVICWFLDRDLALICEHTGQPFEAEDPESPAQSEQ